MWMNIGMVECRVQFWGTVTLTLISELALRIFVSGAFSWYVHAAWDDEFVCHPPVTVTLTSDLVSRIGIGSCAYLLYSLR